MASIRSFFKEKKQSKKPAYNVSEEISIETLKQLIPIRNLDEEKLKSFVLDNRAESLPKGKILFSINETTDSAIYLLNGIVSLSDNLGKSFDIDASDAEAKFPLSSGVKHSTTAIAKTDISFICVSQKIMSTDPSKKQLTKIQIPATLSNSRILQLFAQHFQDEELEIPLLPSVAIKLRKAMQNDIGVDDAVKIIQMDPVISAKLIDVANCPLYVSAIPAKSCFEAVNRIGLYATRNLVISLCIKDIFKSDSKKIKHTLKKLWKRSLYLSSLSFVLASASKQKSPEEALLAGLICDIGVVPFLNFVANLPADYYDEEEIDKVIPVVKAVVGASLLKKWGFSDEFIEVALLSDDWYQNSGDSLSYTDIVVLSRLHAKIGSKEKLTLPAITSIPAASKLKNMSLSPENSLQMLHDAKDKINDALKSFSV